MIDGQMPVHSQRRFIFTRVTVTADGWWEKGEFGMVGMTRAKPDPDPDIPYPNKLLPLFREEGDGFDIRNYYDMDEVRAWEKRTGQTFFL